MKEKVNYLKEVFDKFLKDNELYDAWYERYRLDNVLYNDDVPIESFIEEIIRGDSIGSLFYSGIAGTCLSAYTGCDLDKFIEENKKTDVLSNLTIMSGDEKWVKTWESLVDKSKL